MLALLVTGIALLALSGAGIGWAIVYPLLGALR
jgi:hypothetical protein